MRVIANAKCRPERENAQCLQCSQAVLSLLNCLHIEIGMEVNRTLVADLTNESPSPHTTVVI